MELFILYYIISTFISIGIFMEERANRSKEDRAPLFRIIFFTLIAGWAFTPIIIGMFIQRLYRNK